MTFPDRKTEILQKTIFQGTAYWSTADAIQKIIDPHDSYSRQIALKNKMANGAMDRITMPSALLSRILLSQDPRQKQVVIGHRGR